MFKYKAYTTEQWNDFNLVRHWTRTSVFYFYLSVLLLFISFVLIQRNIILSGVDSFLEFETMIAEWKIAIGGTQEVYDETYKIYQTCRGRFVYTWKFWVSSILGFLDLFRLENLQKTSLEELHNNIVIRIGWFIKLSERLGNLAVEFAPWFLSIKTTLFMVGALDSIFVYPIILFFFNLAKFGDLPIYLFTYLGWYSLSNRDTFIYDRGLSYNYPIYLELHWDTIKSQPEKWHIEDHTFRDYLETHLYQIFDSDGKKWPEKLNADYSFYDKDRRRLVPLDSSKFQLFIGDPQDHRRIDCSQFQIYKNCTIDYTEDGIAYTEHRVYNNFQTPYPFINNTAYTLYNRNNDPLDITQYHIFDLKGNKLEYSFFCSSWKESGLKYKPSWTVDRKEHYIFNRAGQLQNNMEVRIRYYYNKKWMLKNPKER